MREKSASVGESPGAHHVMEYSAVLEFARTGSLLAVSVSAWVYLAWLVTWHSSIAAVAVGTAQRRSLSSWSGHRHFPNQRASRRWLGPGRTTSFHRMPVG